MHPTWGGQNHIYGLTAPAFKFEGVSGYVRNHIRLPLNQSSDSVIVVGEDLPFPGVLDPVDIQIRADAVRCARWR